MIYFLSLEQVIELHDALVEEHGGLSGIRVLSLLNSAIEMPKSSMFGQYLHETIYDKAAAYLFHLVQKPPL